MNTKKLLLCWLAALAVTVMLSGLWHGVLLVDFYTEQNQALAREQIKMPFVILGQVILTLLMAVVYPVGYKGGPAMKEGSRFGALMGLIWILPWSVSIHGLWNYPLLCVIVDSSWHVVEQGLAGIALALVYGAGEAKA